MHQPMFWHFDSGPSTSKLAEWADDMDYESTVTCAINDGHQRAGKRLPHLSVSLPGSRVEDIVWTWYSECLVTDRVLELFKAHGFTGFKVKPVKVRFKRAKEEPPRLWELVVTGSAGVAPPESGIKLLEHCSGCDLSYYSSCTDPSKLIDAAKWDGSDLFNVWPLGKYIFVTERVAQMIRYEGLTGATLKLPDELDFSGNRTGRISVDVSSYPMSERSSQ